MLSCLVTAALAVAIAVPAAYALSRFTFAGRENVLRGLLLLHAFPALALLANGNWVVVAGVEKTDQGDRIIVFDPKASLPEPLPLDESGFCAAWHGDVILVKPARKSLRDPTRPFGFLWFAPELLRQRRLFTDVIAAALVLYALGLAVPIFSQLVIDKVLMHESYATLYVLAGGVALALAFDWFLPVDSDAVHFGVSGASFFFLMLLTLLVLLYDNARAYYALRLQMEEPETAQT